MNDPFGNMNGLINQFRQFMGNPMQFLSQKKAQSKILCDA